MWSSYAALIALSGAILGYIGYKVYKYVTSLEITTYLVNNADLVVGNTH